MSKNVDIKLSAHNTFLE